MALPLIGCKNSFTLESGLRLDMMKIIESLLNLYIIRSLFCMWIKFRHSNCYSAMQEIHDQGGRKFWVHNTGPLGCLPQKLALAQNSSQNLDSIGCISSYNAAAKLFNEGLLHMCTALRSEIKDASIVYVDVFAIKFDLIANSTTYGKNH